MNPSLIGVAGPMTGQQIELPLGFTTIGREAGNSILVSDQTVSRQHVRIQVISGVATVEDAGSSGGTFINEARISGPTTLKPNDILRMGGSSFRFASALSVSPLGGVVDIGGAGTMPSRAGRKKEVGSQELPKVDSTPFGNPTGVPLSANSGCMPTFNFDQLWADLQGCLAPFLKFLIFAVIALVLLAIIGGILFAVGVAGSAGQTAAGASAAAGGGGDAGSDSSSNQPQSAPPPADTPPASGQPQPANGTIQIVSAQVKSLTRDGYVAPVPVVLITWKNVGSASVTEVFADIAVFDAAGRPVGALKAVRIYHGPGVGAGQTHADLEATEGETLPVTGTPASVKVTPTEIRG